MFDFEQIIAELNKKLDELRPYRVKMESLLQDVQDKAMKDRLENKYNETLQAINRAALCVSILNYSVSLEESDDFKVVKII